MADSALDKKDFIQDAGEELRLNVEESSLKEVLREEDHEGKGREDIKQMNILEKKKRSSISRKS
jgi:hypothetical protein